MQQRHRAIELGLDGRRAGCHEPDRAEALGGLALGPDVSGGEGGEPEDEKCSDDGSHGDPPLGSSRALEAPSVPRRLSCKLTIQMSGRSVRPPGSTGKAPEPGYRARNAMLEPWPTSSTNSPGRAPATTCSRNAAGATTTTTTARGAAGTPTPTRSSAGSTSSSSSPPARCGQAASSTRRSSAPCWPCGTATA